MRMFILSILFTISINSFSQKVNPKDLIGTWIGIDSLRPDRIETYKFIDNVNLINMMKVEDRNDTFELKYTLDTLADMSVLSFYNPVLGNMNIGNFDMKEINDRKLKGQYKKDNHSPWDYDEIKTRTFYLIKQDP